MGERKLHKTRTDIYITIKEIEENNGITYSMIEIDTKGEIITTSAFRELKDKVADWGEKWLVNPISISFKQPIQKFDG